jgi:hypothetical protein
MAGVDMLNKKLIFIGFILLTGLIYSNPLYPQNLPMPGMKCDGSQLQSDDGWVYIPAGETRVVTIGGVRYRCTGCGGCTPLSKSDSQSTPAIPVVPGSGGLSQSQQMQMMMIQGILQPMINSMFQSLFTPPQQGPSLEELQRQKEEQLRREAQERFELLNRWHSVRQQYTKSSKDRNKNLSSLLSVDLGPGPEDELIERPSGTPFFNDAASVFGNLVMDKSIENIEDIGKEVIDKLGEKYKKEWGSKLYEKGLPILKIAVTATTEGKEAGGVETINYAVSLLSKPMTSIQAGVVDIGRKIYTKIAFGALDNFLEETEKAGRILGFDFSKDAFKQDFEDSMTTSQRIIYRYLKGE